MTLSTRRQSALPEGVHKLLTQRIESNLELPIQSSTSARVMALCNDDNCNASSLSELIAFDQALSGHVLAIANSALYAPREPILSLRQAVGRLGIETIREIALAISLKSKVFDVPGYAVLIRDLWTQSAATAAYSRVLAIDLGEDVEGAFLCGLLHNVGMPIVLQNLVDMSRERTNRAIPETILHAAMEEFHHEVGRRMIDSWELPEWVAAVVEHYDEAGECPDHAQFARICHLAQHLGKWALTDGLEESDYERSAPLEQALGLDASDVDALLRQRDSVLEVAEAFL